MLQLDQLHLSGQMSDEPRNVENLAILTVSLNLENYIALWIYVSFIQLPRRTWREDPET